MELGVFFVFLGGLSLCAGLVFVFSFFGVQSETYEEALKKQKEANKKEKKEKKQTTEKKKKVKKGKEPKNNNVIVKDFDDQVLVEGSGAVVEPVFVQPPAAVEIAKPKKEVKKEPKKKEEKKKAAEPKVEIPAAEPEPENLSVKEKQAVFEKQTVVEKKAVVEKPAVVEKKAVVEARIEAAAVQTSAAPVPQKKKIEIQEVGDVKTDEAEEKKKKKGGKDSKPKKSNKSNYDEILAVIRKSPLSSSEAQGIVDLLLVKQTGKDESMDGDDWIEPGKESEAKKTARLLSDLTAELEEEKSKSSTWEKKIQTIRKELNESRSVASGHKREMDELTSKKNNEIATLNARLTQNSVQFNTMTDRSRQLETNQAQYQTTINNLKTQLSQVAQPAVDSKMSGDMEQLKNAKIELTASNTSLQQKFKTKCDEVETLTTDKQKLTAALDTAAAGKKQMEANLASAAQEKDALVQEKAALSAQLESQQAGNENLSSSKQQFDAQLSTITAAKTQLQQDLSALKEKLSGKEVECSRLLEENERLSEQVASSVERPAAEGEEAVKVNGHQEVPQAKTVSDPWEEKYKEAEEKYMELSLKLKQIDAKSEGVEEELSSTKAELSKLRTKNDTDVSAFSSYKAECAGVFGRLVPTLKADSDLSAMEKQARAFIQSLEASSSSGPQVEDLSEEITKLEAQTLNYKTVLAQTENMLTTLQASVESAEGEWKKKLQVVESECREFKSNTESLKSSNEQLQSRVKELEGDGATLERLAEELEAAKDSKNALAKKCSELQELVVSGQQQINNTTQLQNNVGGSGPKQGFVHVTVHQAQDLMDKEAEKKICDTAGNGKVKESATGAAGEFIHAWANDVKQTNDSTNGFNPANNSSNGSKPISNATNEVKQISKAANVVKPINQATNNVANGVESLNPATKVAEYIQSLNQLDVTPDKLDLSLEDPLGSSSTPLKPKFLPPPPPTDALPTNTSQDRSRVLSEDLGNVSVCPEGDVSVCPEADASVCSSRSGRSRTSRVSDLGSMSGRFGKGTLGNFYGAGAGEMNCPFPEEWQYNTIPEVIGNDDEID